MPSTMVGWVLILRLPHDQTHASFLVVISTAYSSEPVRSEKMSKFSWMPGAEYCSGMMLNAYADKHVPRIERATVVRVIVFIL